MALIIIIVFVEVVAMKGGTWKTRLDFFVFHTTSCDRRYDAKEVQEELCKTIVLENMQCRHGCLNKTSTQPGS